MKMLFTRIATAFPAHYAALLFCSMLCFINSVEAQPELTFTPIVQGLSRPVEVENANDGSGRLFIVEQDGRIRIYKDGALLSTPFLDITNLCSDGKYKGLISVAFSPNYKKNRTFFVYYLDYNNAATLAKYKTSKNNPDLAVKASGKVLFALPPVDTGDTKISMGNMHFGSDKKLYMTISDGSYIDKVTNLSQATDVLYGKMIRLDVNRNDSPYYRIPPDNPFIGNPDVRPEIFSIGLRNMWRWSFDKATNDMWMADDGNSNRDEVDHVTFTDCRGANFGWKCYEGNEIYDTTGCSPIGNYKFPVYDYAHDSIDGGFAIIGGYVYRGTQYPSLQGYYICSDFITSNGWKIKPNGAGGVDTYLQHDFPDSICGYGQGEDGELYAADLNGTVFKIGVASALSKPATSSTVSAIVADNKAVSKIYPTVVDNSMVVLELNDVYNSMRVFDMRGREVMRQKLNGEKGRVTVTLPKLQAGMYIIHLDGAGHNMEQKIYVSQ